MQDRSNQATQKSDGAPMRVCFCIGPQAGAPACPCLMRGRGKDEGCSGLNIAQLHAEVSARFSSVLAALGAA